MKKGAALPVVLAVIVLSFVLLASCTPVQPGQQPQSQQQILPQQEQQLQPQPEEAPQEVKVEAKPYKYVTVKPTGWFRTGQEADVVLYATGFGESGGPLVLNHPGKVATDGKRLIVSDTWNNRVLVWNDMPTESNQPPDLVLGQEDFYSNTPGLGANMMNWPMGVATDGQKLLVADTNNNRILIWGSFPTQNGQPADLVLGVSDFNTRISSFGERDKKTFIDWPWDVWTDGTRVVASGGDGTLIWNTFPTTNNIQADIVIGTENFTTRFTGSDESEPLKFFQSPRGIASDGKKLFLGTYHPHRIYVYNNFPTHSGQSADFFIELEDWGAMGLTIKNNKLFAISHSRYFIWDSLPSSANQKADVEYSPFYTNEQIQLSPDKKIFPLNKIDYSFGITSDGQRLFIADTHNNRILIWNEIPKDPKNEADIQLGNPGVFCSRNSFCSGPIPFSDGERLIVGVDGVGVWIYNRLPDESKAAADVVVGGIDGKTIIGGYAMTSGNKLIMVHREGSKVVIWNEMPTKDNQNPDTILGLTTELWDWNPKGTGRSGLNSPTYAATDGKSLFVSDSGNNRVLIWNQIPTINQTLPDFVLGQDDFDSGSAGDSSNRLNSPAQISVDSKHLAVADGGNQRILIWNLPIVKNGQEPDLILKRWVTDAPPEYPEGAFHFNLPQGVQVYGNRLFVADGGFNRILIWNKFPETNTTPPDIVLGQKNFYDSAPANTKDNLFVPVSISFDGSFLWVGEVKWSNRLLRFSVRPS